MIRIGKKAARLVLIFLVLSAATAFSDIYSWTDSRGIRHFSNIAPPPSGKAIQKTKEDIVPTRAPGYPDKPKNSIPFKVVRVYDGDSLKVRGEGNNSLTFMVRLVGIDTPETGGKHAKGQPFSGKAKAYLQERVTGRTVFLKSYGIGGYNRQLAEVFVDGRNVNLEMVRSGMAEVYRGRIAAGVDTAMYKRAESFAKTRGKGIWSLGADYTSPREWRKAHPRN